jgi:predicted RND superfamily exporter protein
MSLQKVRRLSASVDAGLSTTFRSLAIAVTNRPLVTIVVSTLIAFALIPGMIIGKVEESGEKLWTPQDTVSQDQKEYVRNTFGAGDRRARAYSGNNGVNLLTRESLLALQRLQTGMFAVTAKCEEGSCDGKTIQYSTVKAKPPYSILSIWGDTVPPQGTDILADVNDVSKRFSTGGDKLDLDDMIGGIGYDSNGKVVSASAFLTTLWLNNNIETLDSNQEDPATDAWELKFDDYVKDFTDSALVTNHPWTDKGESEAGGDAIRGDLGMLSSGYFLLIGFSVVVMSHHKRVQSNGVMAFASVLSIGFSIVSTFGICGYLGIKQNPVTSTLYLVLLGIGVDDAYVIMGEYANTAGSPQDRVVKALTKAGTSIAVTSVTDMVAFAAGVSSTLPALRDFCIFAAFGILFDFAFQCTFFVAILYYRARCTADNRPDWLCCMHVDPESIGCCACSAPICSREGKCVCCPCTVDVTKDLSAHDASENASQSAGLTKRALNTIVKFTLSPIGNVIVLVCTLGLLGGAVAGFPSLKTDFDISWFTPDGDEYKDTYDFQKKYFPAGGGFPVYVYTKAGNYALAHSDGSLTDLYQRAATCSAIDRVIANWYTDFTADAGRSTRSKASDLAFATEVKAFVDSAAGARFKEDIVFATDASGIVSGIRASKTMYLTKETYSGEEDISMTKNIRGCVADRPLEAFAYFYGFLFFDGLDVVDKETIQNVLIACACVFVVNFVMLADFFAALIVLLSIGLVDVCILGYMGHWDLNFNSVTAINLVLAVGLAIDYSAHIAHSFLTSKGSGMERAMHAVDHIGASVFNGGFSTFLAVLPLGLSKSYVFQVFFKMWLMIILFGLYFGIIVLPVVLKFVSPIVGVQEDLSKVNDDKGAAAKKLDADAIGQKAQGA